MNQILLELIILLDNEKHVVILGANGGIGSEIVKSFSNYNITKITKKN
jgi:FlaA1/EpsC-like NDP-sugar epimerase